MNNLEPKIVFKYFKEISQIPRCSTKEQEISDYLVSFAKNNQLEVYQDDILNVIIKKNGTAGYEYSPTVILQGHMDMVCEKNKNTDHDFDKDPIKLLVNGNMLSADNTTLGADNGIAVAFCLALLESDNLPHPPLEILITTQEEIGLIGASKVDFSKLNGKFLINIDAEDEGILFVSCAGGVRSTIELPIVWNDLEGNYSSYSLSISELKGGHSGMDIDKNRGNANKLLGRVLKPLISEGLIYIRSVHGGLKTNAIPRESTADIFIEDNNFDKINEHIKLFDTIFKNEFKTSDKNISVVLEKTEKQIDKVFSNDTIEKLDILYTLSPFGIQTMSSDIANMVESSVNLGIVSTNDENISFFSASRSSIKSLKENILNQMYSIAKTIDANIKIESSYPEWEYKKNSILRDKFIKVHTEMYDEPPLISAIHAGLECGLFSEISNNIDMISFGPSMYDVHTPDERLSISSTKNSWEYLCNVLKELK